MSVRFDINTDHYTATTGLPTSASFSVCCVFRLTTDRNTWQGLWSLDTVGVGAEIYMTTSADGTTMSVWDRTIASSFLNCTVGTWYMVGLSVTGAGTVTIVYGPAASGISGLTTFTAGGFAVPNPPTQMSIGQDRYGAAGNDWIDGGVAAFKVWDAALTVAELTLELAQTAPIRLANLLRFHPFHVAELTDYSGNGNTLTAGSTSTTTEDDPPVPWQTVGRPKNQLLHPGRGPSMRLSRALWVPSTTVIAATGPLNLFSSVADTAAASDTLARAFVQARSLADTASASDAVSRGLVQTRALADTATASDSVVRSAEAFTRSLGDTALASDALARALTQSRSLSDTASATDAVTRTRTSARTLADSAPASDSLSRAEVYARTVADSAAASDVLTRALVQTRPLSDTAAATDAVTRSRTTARPLSDTAVASDTLSRGLVLARALADTAAAVDVLSASSAGHLSRSISDTAAAVDVLAASGVRTRSVSDTANAVDALARVVTHPRSVADSATASDSVARAAGRFRQLLDNAPAGDTLISLWVGTRVVADTASASDGLTRTLSSSGVVVVYPLHAGTPTLLAGTHPHGHTELHGTHPSGHEDLTGTHPGVPVLV